MSVLRFAPGSNPRVFLPYQISSPAMQDTRVQLWPCWIIPKQTSERTPQRLTSFTAEKLPSEVYLCVENSEHSRCHVPWSWVITSLEWVGRRLCGPRTERSSQPKVTQSSDSFLYVSYTFQQRDDAFTGSWEGGSAEWSRLSDSSERFLEQWHLYFPKDNISRTSGRRLSANSRTKLLPYNQQRLWSWTGHLDFLEPGACISLFLSRWLLNSLPVS